MRVAYLQRVRYIKKILLFIYLRNMKLYESMIKQSPSMWFKNRFTLKQYIIINVYTFVTYLYDKNEIKLNILKLLDFII